MQTKFRIHIQTPIWDQVVCTSRTPEAADKELAAQIRFYTKEFKATCTGFIETVVTK